MAKKRLLHGYFCTTCFLRLTSSDAFWSLTVVLVTLRFSWCSPTPGGISYNKDGGTRRKFLQQPLRDTKITSQLTRWWSSFSWQTTEPFSSHLMIKKWIQLARDTLKSFNLLFHTLNRLHSLKFRKVAVVVHVVWTTQSKVLFCRSLQRMAKKSIRSYNARAQSFLCSLNLKIYYFSDVTVTLPLLWFSNKILMFTTFHHYQK